VTRSAREDADVASAAHVHSLLHCNINSSDLKTAAAFYEGVLGQVIGMRTVEEPVDGVALGVEGQTTTLVWFLYDARGPRSAPAIELMDWISPAAVGAAPADPQHAGLAAVGYAVPSLADLRAAATAAGYAVAGESDAWPLRDDLCPVLRLRDHDGVVVEVHEQAVPSPQFSHLRLNVRDLDASIAWYDRIGFVLQSRHDDVRLDAAATGLPGAAVLSAASLGPAADPTLSLELTQWSDPAVTGAPITPAYHVGLYRIALAVDDVAAARAELAAIWPDVPEPIWVALPGTRLGGVTVLFLNDPDGVVVELVERPRRAMSGRG
jgi:catechol 2,3-dioxygenase-like lactoylglutathione lyase family enzyme